MSIVRITGRATMRGSSAPSPGRDRGSDVLLLPNLGLKVQDDGFDLGAPHGGTQIRFGNERVELRSGGTLDDAACLLAGLARANVRAIQKDEDLRTEAIRRTLSPPIDRCYVKGGPANGLHHDCTGESGFQYASDEEQQALEGCKPSDVWSDLRALLAGHQQAGRGPKDPIVCDCDDLAPAAAGMYAWLAWFAPDGLVTPKDSWYGEGQKIMGLGEANRKARFALAITRPPRECRRRIRVRSCSLPTAALHSALPRR